MLKKQKEHRSGDEKMERMFVFEKETKRTWRFQEAGEEPLAIGTLYVQKSVIKEKPKKIKVTVEVIE